MKISSMMFMMDMMGKIFEIILCILEVYVFVNFGLILIFVSSIDSVCSLW